MGMAFNRSTWHEIKGCAKHFCSYDDYNWDWSLHYTSQHCLKMKLYAIVAKGPRVFHIGECGLHQRRENCDLNQLAIVEDQLRNASDFMYPEGLKLSNEYTREDIELTENGGWADLRDIALCLSISAA